MPSYVTSNTPDTLQRPPQARASHIVHIYPNEQSLAVSLLEYFTVGLIRGDTCIAIATPATIINLNKGLRSRGINLSRAIEHNQYLSYDAEELLAGFMQNRLPDPMKFLKTIGGIVAASTSRARPVRAFGELVTLLLRQGNIAGLLQLEKYWNNLMSDYPFSLYCAYPESSFDHTPHNSDLQHSICDCHSLAIGKLLDNAD